MKTHQSYPVIIPAAGIGSRMAASKAKQYLKLGDKTILEHTINAFISHPQISTILLVLHPDDTLFSTLLIANHPNIQTLIGGKERVNSVLAALQTMVEDRDLNANNEQWVLVHDAARPCVQADDISKLINQVSETNSEINQYSGGGILAVPVADTLKESLDDTQKIKRTVDRTRLWQAQTPQMFPVVQLLKNIEKSLDDGANITDEASAMEHCGYPVSLIEGQSSNIKVTRPSDLDLARYYLSTKQESQQ